MCSAELAFIPMYGWQTVFTFEVDSDHTAEKKNFLASSLLLFLFFSGCVCVCVCV